MGVSGVNDDPTRTADYGYFNWEGEEMNDEYLIECMQECLSTGKSFNGLTPLELVDIITDEFYESADFMRVIEKCKTQAWVTMILERVRNYV